MCPILQTYSPEYPLDMFFTDSIPIIPSFTDPIKSPITFLITIPFPHSDLALNLTLSDSISRPQEPSLIYQKTNSFYPSTTPLFPYRNITPNLSNLIYRFHI